MRVIVMESLEQICEVAAGMIADVIQGKPDSRLGLASGGTAEGVYSYLVRTYREGKLDFSRVSSINPEEYLGLGPEHPQSCRHFMDVNLFDRVNIDKRNTFVPKGTGDLEGNIREFRYQIQKAPIDVQLLDVGADGHIGFNRPGRVFHNSAHVAALDPGAVAEISRFFSGKDEAPVKAISMGMGEIMRAKKLLVLAAGEKKANALRELLANDELDMRNPVTMLKMHPDVTVLMEKGLADLVGYIY